MPSALVQTSKRASESPASFSANHSKSVAHVCSWLETTKRGASFKAGNSGFASISRRRTLTKPLIAAVNGICFGGGTELVSNCDIVVAWEGAKFGLPEVSRGVFASQGGIPRIAAAAGHQVGLGCNVYQPLIIFTVS